MAPSILSADFAALGRDIAAAERGGADSIHVDVMDGHFVPNITIGPPVVRAIKRVATRPLDVHLMIEDPDRYIEAFVDGGRRHGVGPRRSVPASASHGHVHQELGAKAGVVLNPSTPVAALEDDRRDVDFVLVMSVNPGFGGQAFIPHSLDKLRRVRAVLDGAGSSAPIEIDGGIDSNNVAEVVSAGASILVAGQADLRHAAIRSAPRAPSTPIALQAAAQSASSRDTRTAPRLACRVRYADTDQMGVVYYANYLVWFEVGRTEWLRDTGWSYREMEEAASRCRSSRRTANIGSRPATTRSRSRFGPGRSADPGADSLRLQAAADGR